MKAYEEILKSLDAKTRETFEEIEDALQMMSPADGANEYRQAHKSYRRFCETLDVADLAECAATIARVTGYRIPV